MHNYFKTQTIFSALTLVAAIAFTAPALAQHSHGGGHGHGGYGHGGFGHSHGYYGTGYYGGLGFGYGSYGAIYPRSSGYYYRSSPTAVVTLCLVEFTDHEFTVTPVAVGQKTNLHRHEEIPATGI